MFISKYYLIASKRYKHQLSEVYMLSFFCVCVQKAAALSAHDRVNATLGKLLIHISL